jgi:hypothetical protein
VRVKCIEPDPIGLLELGKKYIVNRETDDYYYLHGLNPEGGWDKSRFQLVKETNPLVGKTIYYLDEMSVNVKNFYFTDGTGVELQAECGSDSFAIPFFEVKKFTYKLRSCGRIGKVTYLP